MKRTINLLAVALSAATWAAPVSAQPAAAAGPVVPAAGASRPKVCLVLSGGGARGAAHVGVIKVLEEYRVPIDCIVGTSMGSLVGGAYATGMSVAEMEKVNEGITVERLFKEKPPREELAMRRKIDDYQNYLGLEFGTTAGKASVGKGVVSGVQLETVLRSLARVQGYHRFDELPIQYRAVATDLVTGKEVVFSDGELANVMRASMSVPGAVAPAEYRGMILVDGMLTSNLPVQAARAMGADVVIAVNVGTPLLKREELRSIVGVANQMLSILTEQNVQASLALLKPSDILISPELGDFSTSDFDNLPKISPLGEAAARRVADRLAELSLSPDAYAALRRRQQMAMPTELKPVDEIRFDGLSHVNPQVAQGIMQTQVGKPVAQAGIDSDMRRLYGTGDFEHVDYRITEQDGRRVLTVDAVEKAWGPNYMRLGVGLSSDFTGETLFTLLGSHRMTWLNSLGAEFRTDVQLGYDSQIRGEYYQPFDVGGRYFVAPRASLGEQRINVYQGNDRVAVIQRGQSQIGIDVGTQFAQYGELRFGVEGGSIKPRLDTGPPVIEAGETNYDQGAYRLSMVLDRLGSVDFPRSGWSAVMQVAKSTQRLGADADYTRWRASGSYVQSFGENTIRLSADAGGKIGSNPLPYYDLFQWGGFLRQSGYATGQLIGGDLKFGQVSYYRRLARSFLVEGAYGGVALELGKVSKPLVTGNPDGLMKSIAFFVGADSIVGPVYLGYGHAADGSRSMYFFLGNPY